MINTGTLIGAPIRVNDDQDTYPSAIDNEIQGGRHSVDTTTTRDAIPAARRSPGMECYVFADGNTYKLANDLVTWNLDQGATGGSSMPGSGGTAPDITLISGNFGVWTALPSSSVEMINNNFPLSYKADLLAFPTRAIVYIQGQFGLDAAFAGTTLLLGILPANGWPAAQIKKYFIFQNIEMFLQIDTNGDVSLISKDGFNLPTTSGTPEVQPIYLDLFFIPVATTYTPTVYSYTRTQNFDRDNCGLGFIGSTVSYSETYTSTIDMPTATAIAMADPNYDTAGQAAANAGGSCSVDSGHNAFVVNDRTAGAVDILFTDSHAAQTSVNGLNPATGSNINIPADVYSVDVTNHGLTAGTVQIDNNMPVPITAGGTVHFAGLNPVITVIVR